MKKNNDLSESLHKQSSLEKEMERIQIIQALRLVDEKLDKLHSYLDSLVNHDYTRLVYTTEEILQMLKEHTPKDRNRRKKK